MGKNIKSYNLHIDHQGNYLAQDNDDPEREEDLENLSVTQLYSIAKKLYVLEPIKHQVNSVMNLVMLIDKKTYPNVIRLDHSVVNALSYREADRVPTLRPRYLCMMKIREHIRNICLNQELVFLYDNLDYPMSIKMLNLICRVHDPNDSLLIFSSKSSPKMRAEAEWKQV